MMTVAARYNSDPSTRPAPINYTLPENYRCVGCGAAMVQLWREFNTFLEDQKLRCFTCACKDQERDPADLKGDQIGWLVPAVPTEDGETFWGYSFVPENRVNWWHSLPRSVEEGIPATVRDMLLRLMGFRFIKDLACENNDLECYLQEEGPYHPITLSLQGDSSWILKGDFEVYGGEEILIRTRVELGVALANATDAVNVYLLDRKLRRRLYETPKLRLLRVEVTPEGVCTFTLYGQFICQGRLFFTNVNDLQDRSICAAFTEARRAMLPWLRRTKAGRWVTRGKTYRNRLLALQALVRGLQR